MLELLIPARAERMDRPDAGEDLAGLPFVLELLAAASSFAVSRLLCECLRSYTMNSSVMAQSQVTTKSWGSLRLALSRRLNFFLLVAASSSSDKLTRDVEVISECSRDKSRLRQTPRINTRTPFQKQEPRVKSAFGRPDTHVGGGLSLGSAACEYRVCRGWRTQWRASEPGTCPARVGAHPGLAS